MLDAHVSLRVGSLSAAPGERVAGFLSAGEARDGSAVGVPVVLLRGAEAGPVLYVQAVSDGDELNGLGVIHRLLREIEPSSLRGGVIVVPIANYHAFHARQAYSPIDGKKLNRCFPGRPDGSTSERLAHRLFHDAVLASDLCIDLHQGGVRPMIDEVRVRTPREHTLHDACLELARVFGIGYILDEPGPPGQLAQAAPDRGIPTVDPELGGCHGWDRGSIQKGLRGLRNVLCHYGFVDGTVLAPARQWLVRRFVTVRAERGGFVECSVALYEHVNQGDELATICNVFGQAVETILAPSGGVVWSLPIYPSVASGEAILTLGDAPEELI